MTREEKVNLLNELLEIEEKNDIGNLTTAERREFQQWVEALEQEPRKDYLSIDDVMSVFDDFMCGEVDGEGKEIFLNMLVDKIESEG